MSTKASGWRGASRPAAGNKFPRRPARPPQQARSGKLHLRQDAVQSDRRCHQGSMNSTAQPCDGRAGKGASLEYHPSFIAPDRRRKSQTSR